MLVTSKEANKLLKQLENEHNNLLLKENMSKTFLAAVGEDIESCRPEYDYEDVQKQLESIETKIIKIKHAINQFNTKTIIKEYNMSIDELLVYIPLLTQRKNKLSLMMSTMSKTREEGNMRSTIIDYRYANYDVDKSRQDYDKTCEELSNVQIALDTVNVTEKFELDI